jgi:SSS family solute:Na+ symporter
LATAHLLSSFFIQVYDFIRCDLFPLVMTFFWKKATPNAGFYSILVSTAVVLAGLFFEGLTSTNPIIYGMSSGFIVLVGISYLTNYRKNQAM